MWSVRLFGVGSIIKYPYHKGIACLNYTEQEAISILTELWQQKIIITDCKPQNCIRVDGQIKVIDLDGKEYTDNLFLNMCARMYLYIHFSMKIDELEFTKLKRSAINNFELVELQGLREFVNKVFTNIIYEESIQFRQTLYTKKNKHLVAEHYTFNNLPNLELLFFDKIKNGLYLSDVHISNPKINSSNYFEPEQILIEYAKLNQENKNVSLLIKTCAQDVETIEENIKHIVKQLSSPDPFLEVIVSIDTKKTNYLREFNSNGDLDKLISIIKSLKENRVIDNYIIYNELHSENINKEWFNIASKYSHTSTNAPLAPQLFAFSQCKGEYILQMDSDVIIGRKDYCHSYLTDMLSEFDNNNVISVGFNIYNKNNNDYFGFENGGFVPEVRMGLLNKKRIYKLLPLPNELDTSGRLMLTWQRSLHKKQIETGVCSIRGGDNRSFYIHPQNYRKKENYAWCTILDRTEQYILPNIQLGKFDVEGSFYDWAIPKRAEKVVVVSCFRNVSIDRFLRMWCSLMSQSLEDFGIVLLDDCSDNGTPLIIDSLIKPYKDRITFIKNRTRAVRIENEYRVIHSYLSNPDTIVVMLDGDDALIGKNTLKNIVSKYDCYNADTIVGRFHQTYRLQANYRYPVDFTNPRAKGGNVWQHLKTFKKYLFDSIPLSYLKRNNSSINLFKNKWLETCDDFAMMVPIVEMSKCPIQMDEINYFYERDYDNRNDERELKEECIADILTKKRLTPNDVFKGRKSFLPNMLKIEIDITYECNLNCIGCNRSCSQAPTKEHMTLENIKSFIEESISLNKKWELINILGGEPTLHPDFIKIVELLHKEYRLAFSPKTAIQVVSNGITAESRKLCETSRELYDVIVDYGSYKTNNKIEYFSPFNDAPIDDVKYKNSNYKKGCWVTSYCGIGLNKKGYFACAVCGGIDRILSSNSAIPNLKSINKELLEKQLKGV